jgi:hypothetical protein
MWSARVLHHAVVALRDRSVGIDGDDRVHGDVRRHRDVLQSVDVVAITVTCCRWPRERTDSGRRGIPGDVEGEARDGNGGFSRNRTASSMIVRPATKLPRCGVQMNTTRETSGRGLHEHRVLEQLAISGRQRQLRERLAARRVPEVVSAVDDLHLDEQAALTVPMRTVLRRAGSVPSGIELLERLGQRLAQAEATTAR